MELLQFIGEFFTPIPDFILVLEVNFLFYLKSCGILGIFPNYTETATAKVCYGVSLLKGLGLLKLLHDAVKMGRLPCLRKREGRGCLFNHLTAEGTYKLRLLRENNSIIPVYVLSASGIPSEIPFIPVSAHLYPVFR